MPYQPLSLLINEVAWAGSRASANDEWIELHNPFPDRINLEGWTLTDDNDIFIQLQGQIGPYGFFLLERTNDLTVSNISADLIYTGALRNSGEVLLLLDPSGSRVDSANLDGGSWPAGGGSDRSSMERLGGDDFLGNWVSSTGNGGIGLDAEGQSIQGTPRTVNSSFIPTLTPTLVLTTTPLQPTLTIHVPSETALFRTPTTSGTFPISTPTTSPILPTASIQTTATATGTASLTLTPSRTPTGSFTPSLTYTGSFTPSPTPSATQTAPISAPPRLILINEIAWAGTLASASDEWIELHNPNPFPVNLDGWLISDNQDLNIRLSGEISGYGYYLLERTDESTIADLVADQIYVGSLHNNGEPLMLLDPSGALIDSANLQGGSWPGGEASTRRSMERRGGDDRPGNWSTFSGFNGIGRDAAGNPIQGTPRGLNSAFLNTPTPTATLSATPSITHAQRLPYAMQSLLINEIAWAGTLASSSDEWIELYNPGPQNIDLEGWILQDEGDIRIQLAGEVRAGSFYLLERGDDLTITDVPADQLYSGSLSNRGESLRLEGPSGELVDSANLDGGPWPAGSVRSRRSMERRGGEDRSGNWGTFTGYFGNGFDARGSSIRGTPGRINSLFYPTPTPTLLPNKLLINEVLIRPHFDWMGDGSYSTADEFIEIYNPGPYSISLNGWVLDDVPASGSRPYSLPNNRINPGEYLPLFRRVTGIALNDSGDVVRLLAPDGRVIDQIQYRKVRAYNLSYGRLPDGSDRLLYGLWPTPGRANLLYVEPTETPTPNPQYLFVCPDGGKPIGRIIRLARLPNLIAWMHEIGWFTCR